MKNHLESCAELIPLPHSCESRGGETILSGGVSIFYSRGAAQAAEILKTDLKRRFCVDAVAVEKSDMIDFTIALAGQYFPEFAATSPEKFKNESYTLDVEGDFAKITAGDYRGVYWGTRTLLQSIRKSGDKISIDRAIVRDEPRFGRRGVLFDPARNFISVAGMKRFIDLISEFKYNVLHLHIVDDQGWRFESRTHTRLHKVGGNNVFYTQAELRDLVDYAAARGVEILPEIDMPGHSTAMLVAYPELACYPEKIEPSTRIGIHPFAMCPGKEAVYEFVDEIFSEVASVFPSEYIHIGSDEVLAYDWDICPHCAELKKKNGLSGRRGLHSYFIARVNDIAKSRGKKLIAWDEALDLAPEDVAIQVWRKFDYAQAALSKNRKALVGPVANAYLDYNRFFVPLRKCYRFDPVPAGATAEQASNVLGGGPSMWGDFLRSEKDIDRYLFPRMIALSEVYWSRADDLDYESFKSRLKPIKRDLEKRGVEFGDMGIGTVRDFIREASMMLGAGAGMLVSHISASREKKRAGKK